VILIVLQLLFAPVAASIAGVGLWALHRHERMEDDALVRRFVFFLVMAGVALYATINSDSVRRRVDTQYRILSEIEAHPLYDTFKRLSPDHAQRLSEVLGKEMAQGASISDAMLRARGWLTAAGNDRIGFTDQATRLEWGRVAVDSLKELRSRDPMLCQRMISGQPVDSQALQQAFTERNTAAFHSALMAVYEAADKGMRHELPHEQAADFNATALEFGRIQGELERQFGADVAAWVSSREHQGRPAATAERLCSARIAQLEAMLTRPKPTAALLIDSALR
jgi:hypothetical protein